tara:strand:- start:25 stop:207 length:183 start_codon:yes stop_codon:yes gene_type:complete
MTTIEKRYSHISNITLDIHVPAIFHFLQTTIRELLRVVFHENPYIVVHLDATKNAAREQL